MGIAETVFLHIGTNKTGTTALQRYLDRHRAALRERGVLYPQTGCHGAHHPLSQALGFCEPSCPDAALAETFGDQLHREIEASGARHVVISSESFVLPQSPDVVRTLTRSLPLRVIVYLRRHDHWWQSAYNYARLTVNNPPWGASFESYLAWQEFHGAGYWNYRELVDRWAGVCGRENIIVRPYESLQNTPNLLVDFFRSMGLDGCLDRMPRELDRVNESVAPEVLDLLDVYRRVCLPAETRDRMIRHALQQRGSAPASRAQLPARTRLRLIEQNRPDYEYIAREYLGREAGQLFLEPLPDEDEERREVTMVNAIAAVELAVAALQAAPH